MEDIWAKIANPSTSEEGLRILEGRYAERPQDPKMALNLASAYDRLDRDLDARMAYEKVRELGFDKLDDGDQRNWFVQFGSTLRLLGEHEKSRAILREGSATFPDDMAISCFLALTEVAAGDPSEATRLLLDALLRSGDARVNTYRRALTAYVAELGKSS